LPNSCSVSNIFGGSAHALGRVNILLRSFGRSRPATNVSLPEMEMEMPVNVSVPVCLRDWACCVSACTCARVVHTISLVIAACKTYHQMNMQTPFICRKHTTLAPWKRGEMAAASMCWHLPPTLVHIHAIALQPASRVHSVHAIALH